MNIEERLAREHKPVSVSPWSSAVHKEMRIESPPPLPNDPRRNRWRIDVLKWACLLVGAGAVILGLRFLLVLCWPMVFGGPETVAQEGSPEAIASRPVRAERDWTEEQEDRWRAAGYLPEQEYQDWKEAVAAEDNAKLEQYRRRYREAVLRAWGKLKAGMTPDEVEKLLGRGYRIEHGFPFSRERTMWWLYDYSPKFAHKGIVVFRGKNLGGAKGWDWKVEITDWQDPTKWKDPEAEP